MRVTDVDPTGGSSRSKSQPELSVLPSASWHPRGTAVCRPAIAEQRLSADGLVVYELKRCVLRWHHVRAVRAP